MLHILMKNKIFTIKRANKLLEEYKEKFGASEER
jgi:hypothetical protein